MIADDSALTASTPLSLEMRLAEAEHALAQAEAGWAATRDRLAEADETLRAIRGGEVDALVITDGSPGAQVFTLSSADRPYRIFVETMNDGAATVSDAGIILYANPRLASILDTSVEQLVGSPIHTLVAPDDQHFLTPRDESGTVEIQLIAAGGGPVSVLLGTSTLHVDGDQLTCLTFTDLTAQKVQDEVIGRLNSAQVQQLTALTAAQAALTLEATHDALTGLPNRMLLLDRVEQALGGALRSGLWTAVLYVDLDRFKHMNDSRGHSAGDNVLRQVAQRLRKAIRSMDTVARIGGDEFAILAPELFDQIEAVELAGRLARSLNQGANAAKEDENITASIGISVAEAGVASAEAMLHEADTAMHHAKAQGRNRAEVFDPALSLRARLRAATEELLQEALTERRIVAYYQPIVDLTTGQVAGFEALARIIQANQEVLYPDAFIAVAEETGLVVPLGGQMMVAACREAQRWRAAARARFSPIVAVNLSPRQLERANLPAKIQIVLAETGLDAQHLHLEITETALMEMHPEVLRQLGVVRDLGVEIGLDDFGTGYASLTHLRRLPLTFVKVDRSFISGLGADIQDERIAAAVIELSANLGLRSIAEGIETPQQLDRLRELGCDQAQGYLFSRPAPTVDPDHRYSISGVEYPDAARSPTTKAANAEMPPSRRGFTATGGSSTTPTPGKARNS